MRLIASLAVAFVLGLAAAQSARAEDPAAAIPAVIADQIAAFQRNDLAAAFAHAAPSIQTKFRNPQIFGRMVESGYPMIWRPQSYEILGLQVEGTRYVQTVLFQDARGRFYEADYLMTELDGDWRIAGVFLREAPGIAS
ncbi:MAG: DUF4864 domain-containing protein [Paracoccaceae bacterium]